LVGAIVEYIEGPRAALFKKIRVPVSKGEDRLFVSSKTGKPLTNRSITGLVSTSLRAVGAAHGSIHGFRHKFVNDEVEREILFRIDNKMDTSMDSIAVSVSMKVGHANPASLYAYISRTLQRISKYLPEDDLSKIERMEREIVLLNKELRIIKRIDE
jgi:integrase